MNILILMVIAMFIIVGAYVGYHVSQQADEEAEEHDVTMELEILNENSAAQIYHNPELRKSIL